MTNRNIVFFTLLFFIMIFSQNLWAVNSKSVINVNYLWKDSRLTIRYDLMSDAIIDLRIKCFVNGKSITRYLYIYGKIENDNLSGDVGKVSAGMDKLIEWDGSLSDVDFIEEIELISHDGTKPIKTSIIGSFGYSFRPEQFSGGLLVALTSNNIGLGGFLHIRSNYNFGTVYDYICDASGNIDGLSAFYSGKTQNFFCIANVGLTYNFLTDKQSKNMLSLGLGAGYGTRDVFWQMHNGTWTLNRDLRNRGVSAELNLIGSIKGFSLMIGVGTINFRYVDLQVGVGVTF